MGGQNRISRSCLNSFPERPIPHAALSLQLHQHFCYQTSLPRGLWLDIAEQHGEVPGRAPTSPKRADAATAAATSCVRLLRVDGNSKHCMHCEERHAGKRWPCIQRHGCISANHNNLPSHWRMGQTELKSCLLACRSLS